MSSYTSSFVTQCHKSCTTLYCNTLWIFIVNPSDTGDVNLTSLWAQNVQNSTLATSPPAESGRSRAGLRISTFSYWIPPLMPNSVSKIRLYQLHTVSICDMSASTGSFINYKALVCLCYCARKDVLSVSRMTSLGLHLARRSWNEVQKFLEVSRNFFWIFFLKFYIYWMFLLCSRW